jgi:hypothetical protein
MRWAFIACLAIAALLTWAGHGVVPGVSASTARVVSVSDRGADRQASVAPAAVLPFRPESVVDARRRPQALVLSVVAAVPFVCAVHLVEAEAEAATE